MTGIVDEGLGNSSYVVDLGDGGSLVVDPERDPRPYLAELERKDLSARFVFETHLHADFVSGARELVALGAELWAPVGSELGYLHRPLTDGAEVDLGGLTLRVIATPGHTPEHLSYLLHDGSRPVALFSGGTLIAGGVARTDLLSPEQTEPLARAAYRSIRDRLLTLPDDLDVYPTHGSGSFCSVGSGAGRTTTIGAERAANPLLAGDPDEELFVQRLLAGYSTYPPYFLELREVNRQGPPIHGTSIPPLPQLSAADVEEVVEKGAELIDVRNIHAYAAGHIPGAIAHPWRTQFATWLGWLVPRQTPLVLIIDEHVDQEDVVWAALTVGFENIIGAPKGGMSAWAEAGRPTARIPIVREAPGSGARTVLDVRQTSEYATGHVLGAVNVELGTLANSAGTIPAGELLVHCSHGERAMTAASLLARTGRDDVVVFKGKLTTLGELVSDR
ncbi:MAG: MBL fold metallo-hydrolase [Actinomycetota bacterium]